MRKTTTKQSKTTTGARLTAHLGESSYGNPQPMLALEMPADATHRACNAALHRAAALVEEATPAHEGWIVQLDHDHGQCGAVYLELVKANKDEADRGVAVLENVARRGL